MWSGPAALLPQAPSPKARTSFYTISIVQPGVDYVLTKGNSLFHLISSKWTSKDLNDTGRVNSTRLSH
jgi:hypothetical protein